MCITDRSLLDGYLVVSGGVRCGSAEAPAERYYSPTQPPPVTDLLCHVQCITGWAVGGGTRGHTHTLAMKHNLDLICTGSSLYLFVPGLNTK